MNQFAATIIEKFEGRRHDVYLDGGGVPTVGVGHTGPEVKMGDTWDDARIDKAFSVDLAKAENAVRAVLHVAVGSQSIAALTSFVFNLGGEALAKSEALTKINAGKHLEGAKLLLNWDHDNHVEVKGLLIRRLEEAALYLRGV